MAEIAAMTLLSIADRALVESFLRTATPLVRQQAITFCLLASLRKTWPPSYASFASASSVSGLIIAGIVRSTQKPLGPTNPHYLCTMSIAVRDALLAAVAGSQELLEAFYNIVDQARARRFMTDTPTGMNLNRVYFTQDMNATWGAYERHIAAQIPWPADPASPAYVRRALAIRSIRDVLVDCSWWHIRGGRHVLAPMQAALSAAATPQVRGWNSGNPAAEAQDRFAIVDMYVARVHASLRGEHGPHSTSELYDRLLRGPPQGPGPAVGQPGNSAEARAQAAQAFNALMPLLPGVASIVLPAEVGGLREVLTRMVGLAWVDGRWHNRMMAYTSAPGGYW
ncbi:hypothetical protein QBC39DRAFT_370848 [Podospora conica]|nr:hypothetical protein QBC39DRAFT_370848 [Schizothecium conicum]